MKWLQRLRSGKATDLRDRADHARDSRSWNEAAGLYEEYLREEPDDFARWVQMGHVLKEAGRYDEALASYNWAAALDPTDADLLLNLGHLYKRRGEPDKAYAAFMDSVRAGDPGNAAREAEALRPAVIPAPAPPSMPTRAAVVEPVQDRTTAPKLAPSSAPSPADDLLDSLRGRLVGAEIAQTSGISFDGGHYVGTDHDPWITLVPGPAVQGAALAELTIAFDDDAASRLDTKLYFDYGAGFEERFSIKIPPVAGPFIVFVAMPGLVRHIRWDPDTAPSRFALRSITLRPLAGEDEVDEALARIDASPADRASFVPVHARLASAVPTPANAAAIQQRMPPLFDLGRAYDYWLDEYDRRTADDHVAILQMIDAMKIRPSFSFVMPTYNTPIDLLIECIDSMLAQVYPDFEICIADDASSDPEVAAVLHDYAERFSNVRVTVRERNGHISAASNSALALATGDFIVLVDHDDLVPDHALAMIAHHINLNPKAQILYSDEDKIDIEGYRHSPYFKGDFSKFLMFGHNMISHLGAYRRDLVEQVGGFRIGLEGSQDYDLFLRCYERLEDDSAVVHVPYVLYHWRAIPGSTAVSADQKSYAVLAAEAAINGYFERNAIPLRSGPGFAPGLTGIRADREWDTPVSILVPTRDGLDVLKPCLDSVFRTRPDNVEVIVLDNGSQDGATLAYLRRIQREHRDVRVLAYDKPFNFSAINNFGAAHARGEILCFLNNDTEIVTPRWIERARMLLAIEDVGIVGARLVYPDGTLQHFGIGLGMADHKVAGTPHAGIGGGEGGYFGKARLIQDVGAVTAACLFMRKTDYDRVGGMDPELRVAYNDVDLCLKVSQAGLRIVCDPHIELIHKESRTRGLDTTPEKRARLDAEAATMRERWAAQLDGDRFLSPNHALDRPDFALAYPPRVAIPWRTKSE